MNYALIHRHFRSKDGLIESVLLSLAADLDDDLARPRHDDRAGALLENHHQLWRILGYLCLENQEWVNEHVGDHAGFVALRDVVAAAEPDDELVSIRAGIGVATIMGWVILRPFIDKLAQLGGIDEAKVQRELTDAVQRVLLPRGSTFDLDAVDLTRRPDSDRT